MPDPHNSKPDPWAAFWSAIFKAADALREDQKREQEAGKPDADRV